MPRSRERTSQVLEQSHFRAASRQAETLAVDVGDGLSHRLGTHVGYRTWARNFSENCDVQEPRNVKF